jgi:hypothetical protein
MAEFQDLAGQKFGRLEAAERGPSDDKGRTRWWCWCSCGDRVLVRAGDLQSSNTRSCGCWKVEAQAEFRREGSQRRDGGRHAEQVRRAARARRRAQEQLIDEHAEQFDRLYAMCCADEDPPVVPVPRAPRVRARIERELARLQAQLDEVEDGDG